MPNSTSVNSWMPGASASFNSTFSGSTFSGFSLGLILPMFVAAFLLLLTSQRFFKHLAPIFGRFATWIKRFVEGYIVYNLGYQLYRLGQAASETITIEQMINYGKWGIIFTTIGYGSVWTRDRILENAGIELPTLREALTETEVPETEAAG